MLYLFVISAFLASRIAEGTPPMLDCALTSISQSSPMKVEVLCSMKPVRLIWIALASGNCRQRRRGDGGAEAGQPSEVTFRLSGASLPAQPPAAQTRTRSPPRPQSPAAPSLALRTRRGAALGAELGRAGLVRHLTRDPGLHHLELYLVHVHLRAPLSAPTGSSARRSWRRRSSPWS